MNDDQISLTLSAVLIGISPLLPEPLRQIHPSRQGPQTVSQISPQPLRQIPPLRQIHPSRQGPSPQENAKILAARTLKERFNNIHKQYNNDLNS